MTVSFDTAEIVRIANANSRLIAASQDTIGTVRSLIDESDVAVAVWQDKTRCDGVGFLVLKGAERLRHSIADQKPFNARVTAIPCFGEYEARAVKDICGETNRLN